jgi:hypothetical protein
MYGGDAIAVAREGIVHYGAGADFASANAQETVFRACTSTSAWRLAFPRGLAGVRAPRAGRHIKSRLERPKLSAFATASERADAALSALPDGTGANAVLLRPGSYACAA